MKLIKGGLFVFVGLFIVMTLLSLLIPSKIVTAKGITVQSDSLKLFNTISDLKKWKYWHPVFMNDTAAITFSEQSNAVNSFASWNTNGKVNKLVITKVQYPTVEISLQREGENDILNYLSVTPVQEAGNMQVQWRSITKLKWYPWEKFAGIFVEKISGSGYEVALQSLKNYLDKN
jgi:hypothetical protein